VDANEVRAAWERASRRAASAVEDSTSPRPIAAPTFLGAPAARAAEDLEGVGAAVLGIPHSPSDQDVAAGPSAIRRRSVSADMQGWAPLAAGRLLGAASVPIADYGDVAAVPDDIEATFMGAHDKLADIIAAGALPIVFGGDHSVTIPVLQVLAGKLAGKLGIVTFDARLDLELEPRYAAGSQWARAFELGVVEPANFVALGVGDLPASDRARLTAEELGMSVSTTTEIDELGIVAVAQEALEAASAGTEAVYVSVDLAATGAPGEGPEHLCSAGLGARELLCALRTLAAGRVAGLDVIGLAPRCDPLGHLAGLAVCSAVQVLAGLAAQRP